MIPVTRIFISAEGIGGEVSGEVLLENNINYLSRIFYLFTFPTHLLLVLRTYCRVRGQGT